MDKELKSTRFIFSAEPSLIARIDEWRRQQEDIPSRAEAIRRLVRLGVDGGAPQAVVATVPASLPAFSPEVEAQIEHYRVQRPYLANRDEAVTDLIERALEDRDLPENMIELRANIFDAVKALAGDKTPTAMIHEMLDYAIRGYHARTEGEADKG